ncbi:hypothetical protein Unana1_03035 [Umbelopsis nana]
MLQADTQLNELGLQQADLVGQRLANESYDAIYSSDLSRCKQTTVGIAKHHKDTPIIFDKRLREHDFGRLNGKPVSAIKLGARQVGTSDEEFIVDQGGESDQDVEIRVLHAYNEIVNKSLEAGYSHILIVSHGGPLAIIISWMIDKQKYELPAVYSKRGKVGNTSVTTARITSCSGQIEQLNCMKHLEDMMDTMLKSDQGPAV